MREPVLTLPGEDTARDAVGRFISVRDVPAPDDDTPVSVVEFIRGILTLRLPEPPRELGGRPTRLTTGRARRILRGIVVDCLPDRVAAAHAQINPDTFYDWVRRDGEPYETFQAWLLEARALRDMRYHRAALMPEKIADRPDVALKLLGVLEPQDYAPSRTPDASVNVNVSLTSIIQTLEARRRVDLDPRPLLDITPTNGAAEQDVHHE